MCQSLFPECGFFDFQAGGAYREYTFDDNFECTPPNMLSWTLSNGIITATNGTESTDVLQNSANRLVFKFNLMSIQTVSWNY
jgi:hypothetical protein